MSGLFRQQALAHQQDSWLGPVRLLRPPPLGWLAALAVLSAAAVGSFLFAGQASRKAHVVGVLTPERGAESSALIARAMSQNEPTSAVRQPNCRNATLRLSRPYAKRLFFMR